MAILQWTVNDKSHTGGHTPGTGLNRAMFVASTSERLKSVPTHVLKLQQNDIALFGGKHQITVDSFVPRKLASDQWTESTVVQQAIDRLMSQSDFLEETVVESVDESVSIDLLM